MSAPTEPATDCRFSLKAAVRDAGAALTRGFSSAGNEPHANADCRFPGEQHRPWPLPASGAADPDTPQKHTCRRSAGETIAEAQARSHTAVGGSPSSERLVGADAARSAARSRVREIDDAEAGAIRAAANDATWANTAPPAGRSTLPGDVAGSAPPVGGAVDPPFSAELPGVPTAVSHGATSGEANSASAENAKVRKLEIGAGESEHRIRLVAAFDAIVAAAAARRSAAPGAQEISPHPTTPAKLVDDETVPSSGAPRATRTFEGATSLVHGSPRMDDARPEASDDGARHAMFTTAFQEFWSLSWDRCRDCQRNTIRHYARGFCGPCYSLRHQHGTLPQEEPRPAPRWSKYGLCCRACSREDVEHCAYGLCRRCYNKCWHQEQRQLLRSAHPEPPPTPRWSKHGPCCRACSSEDVEHFANGLCRRCYKKQWARDQRQRLRSRRRDVESLLRLQDLATEKCAHDRSLGLHPSYSSIACCVTWRLFEGRCAGCDASEDLTIDHHHAAATGVAIAPDNAVLLCCACHASKGHRAPDDFYPTDRLRFVEEQLRFARYLVPLIEMGIAQGPLNQSIQEGS